MRIRVFVLATALLALVGVCVVQETSRQVRAQYTLAKLQEREDRLRRDLEALKIRESDHLGVERLEMLAARADIPYQPLAPRREPSASVRLARAPYPY